MNLAPGTPCFLTGLVEQETLQGRVVEVVNGPVPDEPDGAWYSVTSEWVRATYPGGVRCLVRRENLLPITPPDIAVTSITKEATH